MKRIFLIISLLILTACSAEQPKQEVVQVIEDKVDDSQKITKVDKTIPIITIKSDLLKTELNKPIDLLDGVFAKDYMGNLLKVEVSGQYYFDIAGTYKLEYIAKDSNESLGYKHFTLVVSEPIDLAVSETPIVCHPDNENGIVADNPYLPCDYVFEENLKAFEAQAIMQFDPDDDGWKKCELEGKKYDKTIYVTDCFALQDNVRNTAKVGLWVGNRDNSIDRQLFQTFQSYLLGKYGIKQVDYMAAELIGAVEGFKYTVSDEIIVEVYKFESKSDAYKKILETGKVTLEGIGDFDIIMNGYYGLFSETYHEEIVNYFKSIE